MRTERVPCFLRTPPISAANIVAVQPDFADPTVGKLGAGLGVDDDAPLTARYLTAGHVRGGAGSVRGDPHGLALLQLLVGPGGRRWVLAVGAMVETNRVASAMPYEGLIAVGGNP